ncbi:MAG: hypothetical protein ACJ8AI_15515 [Rhodopila sp.]|jgi:hypothetical protein
MTDKNEHTGRYGGPGSSHQDRSHPGKNHQPTGKKGGGDRAGTAAAPGSPTNDSNSRVSGGGGERDSHHTHTSDRS